MTTQDVIIPGDTVLSRSSSRAADAPKTYRHRGRMTEQHNRGDVGWRVNDQPAHRPDWSVSNLPLWGIATRIRMSLEPRHSGYLAVAGQHEVGQFFKARTQ